VTTRNDTSNILKTLAGVTNLAVSWEGLEPPAPTAVEPLEPPYHLLEFLPWIGESSRPIWSQRKVEDDWKRKNGLFSHRGQSAQQSSSQGPRPFFSLAAGVQPYCLAVMMDCLSAISGFAASRGCAAPVDCSPVRTWPRDVPWSGRWDQHGERALCEGQRMEASVADRENELEGTSLQVVKTTTVYCGLIKKSEGLF
jgi:hypothetical protein